MIRLVAATPFVLLIALLSACGGGSDYKEPAATPAFPGSDWRLDYSVSGGIAGLSQQLVLDEKGNAQLEDKRVKRTRYAYVVPSDLGMIKSLMAELPTAKSDQGLPHPDAIVTSIKVTSGNKTYGATFNTTPNSPNLAALLRRLAAIYDDNRP